LYIEIKTVLGYKRKICEDFMTVFSDKKVNTILQLCRIQWEMGLSLRKEYSFLIFGGWSLNSEPHAC
jgi:hypothetical protein